MQKQLEEIVEILTAKHKTISTMESCTGGGLANAITNIEGSSEVLKFSAVTYSNDFKIKMGVNPNIIEQYSVYSMETAMEMAQTISAFTDSNFGIGITGKLNRVDKNNLYGNDNIVFVSIYDRDTNEFINNQIEATCPTRDSNKQLVIETICNKLMEIVSLDNR